MDLDVEVMAIDTDPELVNKWAERLTHVRVADGTNPAVVEQLGVVHFDSAVVAIGSKIEASILTTSTLSDAGVQNIWAKAITSKHGQILERVGADHVVYPERQMGERVAHVVTGKLIDYVELDDGFVLVELVVPASLVGKSLGESAVRARFGVTIVCRKPRDGVFTYATSETVLEEGDLLVVASTVADAERFAEFATDS